MFFGKIGNIFTRSVRKRRSPRRVQARQQSASQVQALEERIVLSNLNLLASGSLIYGGSNAINNNLTVEFDGTNYRFEDTAEAINAIGGIAGLDTNPAPNIVEFDPTLIGGAFNRIIINTGGGDDAVSVNSIRGGGENLDIRANAGTDTVTIGGDLGSAGSRITGQVLIRGEQINLGGGIFTANQPILFQGPVDLVAGIGTVDTGTGTITFSETVDGNQNLDIISGLLTFSGDVGATTAVSELTVNSNSIVQFGTLLSPASVSVVNDIGLTATTELFVTDDISSTAGSVILNVPQTTLNSSGTINITSGPFIAEAIRASGGQTPSLNIGSSDSVDISDEIAGIVDLDITSTGAIDLDGIVGAEDISINAGTEINAVGFQASNGNVIVTGDLTFVGAGSTLVSATANIEFNDTVTGNGDNLLIREASIVNFFDDVTGVDSFDLQRGGGLLFTDVVVGNVTANNILIEADNTTIHLRGNLTALTDDILLTGRVVLDGGPATVVLSSGLGAGDDVIITGAIDDNVADTHSLEMRAGAGSAQNLGVGLNTHVGATTPLHSFLASGDIVNLNDVTVATGDLILEGGTINLSGDLTGTGDMIFRPRVNGGGIDLFNLPSSPVSPNMTIDLTDLSHVIPGFNSITIGGATTGLLRILGNSIGNPALAGANLTLGNEISFIGDTILLDESIDQGMDQLSLTANTFNLNFFGVAVGTGDVIFNKRDINGGILNFNGDVGGRNWGNNSVTVNAGTDAVSFNDEVGANLQSFTVNAGAADFGDPTALSVAGDVDLQVTNLTLNGGIFSTTGSITIGGNVTLTGNTTFLVPAGQDLEITGNIAGGGFNILARGRGGAANNIEFSGDVTGLGSLKIDSKGASTANNVTLGNVTATDLTVRGNAIELDGTLQATTGNLHLLGAVTLQGNTSLIGLGGATRFVRVDGTIDGGFLFDANAGAGKAVFTGTIGGATPLTNMDVNTGSVNFITVDITVANNFSWNSDSAVVDKIIQTSGSTITAGNLIQLTANKVTDNGTNIAPIVNIIENP